MSKHTPGPWRVNTVGDPDGDDDMVMRTVHGQRSAGGDEVCIVTTGSYNDDVEAANARLIAAAPELLTCCQEALAAWTGDGPAIELDELRAAIAKATGGTE